VTPINRVPKLPTKDVWTKFEEGRSRGQGVLKLLIGKEKVTDRQTDRQTDMCKAICPLFYKGGHKYRNCSKCYPFL